MDIGSCTDKSYKGFNRIGWWTLLSNVDLLTMDDDDGKVKFHLNQGQFYEIFDGSTMPFSGTNPNVTVTGTHGFKQYNDRVQFPLKQLAPHSSALMYNLSKGIPVVIILEQTDGGEGRFPVYGLPAGLYAHPDMSFELNEERCWEIVLQSFNTGFPQRFLFDTDVATTLTYQKLLTAVGTTFGGGTIIFSDLDAGEVTVVPDGYVEDIDALNLPDTISFVSTYEKNGYSDYELISPAEILALMTNPVLIAKTGTMTEENYWTNDNDGQDGKYYQHSTGTIENGEGQTENYTIPVRRVSYP